MYPEPGRTIHVLYIHNILHTWKSSILNMHYSTLHYTTFMQYATVLVKLLPSKRDPWELLGSQFKVGTKLGEGNYGVVYKGTLSMDVSTAPVQKHMDKMTLEGKNPYTVAIKLLKGLPTMS